jgi:DNA-binding MarR family transcriptional regulator
MPSANPVSGDAATGGPVPGSPVPGGAATAALAGAGPDQAAAGPDQPELADVIAALRRAMRRAARAAGRDGELPGGLSVAQLEMLSALTDNPGARPGQLARLLRLAPSSVATLVNGLRRAGLITRTGGGDDRRTASLLLTPNGQEAVKTWQEINERILQAATAALAPESAAALDAALPALVKLTGTVDALANGHPA